MKTIATAGLLLALLTGALPCQGQTRTKIAVQAGRTLYGNRHAATAPPRLPVEPQSVARDLFGPRQHFIDLRRDSIRLARLRDSLNRGRQAWSERFGERLREEMLADYRRLCAEMEQRKPTRLPQRWVLVGNRAASIGCDSIAVDCMNRFLSYHPSPRLVAHAVDSMMFACPEYARPMVESATGIWFRRYWSAPDTTERWLGYFQTLDHLGERYGGGNRLLAQGMSRALEGDTREACPLFAEAIRKARMYPDLFWSCIPALTHATACLLSDAARYDELLELFAQESTDAVSQYARDNAFVAFLLYRAALRSGSPRAESLLARGMEADTARFTELLRKLRDEVYAAMVEHPQPSPELDYLFDGPLPLAYPQEYTTLAERLHATLPDIGSPYDAAAHCYDESYAPCRDALAAVAERAHRHDAGSITPEGARLRFIAAETRSRFASSAEAGITDTEVLFGELGTAGGQSPYPELYVRAGALLALRRSLTEPKAALKLMTDRVWPVFEQLDNDDAAPGRQQLRMDVYRCMASLYRQAGKEKKATAMQEKADSLARQYPTEQTQNNTTR